MKTTSELLKEIAVNVEQLYNDCKKEIEEINAKDNVKDVELSRLSTLKEIESRLYDILQNKKAPNERG